MILGYTPIVIVDGSRSILSWGEHSFSVSPGTHEVKVSLGDQFFRKLSAARVTVEISQGQTIHVDYRAPLIVFADGKIKVS
jgi:hypothetical protein